MLCPSILEKKNSGPNRFLVQKNLGPKKFRVHENIGSKNFWIQNKFGSNKIFEQKHFGSRKILCLKKYWVLRNFGSNDEPLCTYLDVHSPPEHKSPMTPYGRNCFNKYYQKPFRSGKQMFLLDPTP